MVSQAPPPQPKFLLTITNCSSFAIRSVNQAFGANGLMISNSSIFTVSNCSFSDFEGYGLVLFNSSLFAIQNLYGKNNLASTLLIAGSSSHGLIEDSVFSLSRGYYNCDAGLHIVNCSAHVTPEMMPEGCHEPLSIEEKVNKPSCIILSRSRFVSNRAQGVYLEGAISIHFLECCFKDNNKEGICFDWGSCMCTLSNSHIAYNGNRTNMSSCDLAIDFIEHYQLLDDGSSCCKLPGISIDNGCLNHITSNVVVNNYGGGIKLVRSCIGNLVKDNKMNSNNIGENPFFPVYYEMASLGIGAIQEEFSEPGKGGLMDFFVSVDNVFVDNSYDMSNPNLFHQE